LLVVPFASESGALRQANVTSGVARLPSSASALYPHAVATMCVLSAVFCRAVRLVLKPSKPEPRCQSWASGSSSSRMRVETSSSKDSGTISSKVFG
ncbi:hypothetical protein IMZ48_35140, partial [Candidatus Bathyarchaeota archaeon]|nr:hypothetical protein [Candidatus Bathyarchaeota archaeon]